MNVFEFLHLFRLGKYHFVFHREERKEGKEHVTPQRERKINQIRGREREVEIEKEGRRRSESEQRREREKRGEGEKERE